MKSKKFYIKLFGILYRLIIMSFRHILNFLRNATYILLHGFLSTQKIELIL
jgi:hypothetical protein